MEVCWGTAYEIRSDDPDRVLAGLDHRERGGYERVEVEITLDASPAPNPESAVREPRRASGIMYIAGPRNANYLGEASLQDIARQIAAASGPSGANPEYVFELARSLRAMGAEDAHVFAVEAEVSRMLTEKRPRSDS
jgi:cation transport regulator ChaC